MFTYRATDLSKTGTICWPKIRSPSVDELPELGPDFSSPNLAPARLGLEKSGPDSGDSATDGVRIFGGEMVPVLLTGFCGP